ncbi:hypothetical protein [Campylobacter sp. RM12651]|uniref:hypothetical protein n=1 Tax=Campylobacter sp. RM12651 TaxID=1660079 RepID=UPI001EFA42CE|nr:hypothetical protein [Campylobacter sp. RM12651]ULO03796.1 putative membrane protein [Campylobacter sp. RM12651]
MFINKKIAIGIIIVLTIMNLICIAILSLPNIFIKVTEIKIQKDYIYLILLPSILSIIMLFEMRKYWR